MLTKEIEKQSKSFIIKCGMKFFCESATAYFITKCNGLSN